MHADPEERCFSKEKKLPTGTDNKLFCHMRVVMRRGGVLSFEERHASGSECIGTDCASRDAGTVRIQNRNNKSKWNQYRCGAGIAIREIASVRMHADPEAGCFSKKKKKLPTGIDNKVFKHTRVIMCERRIFFKKRCLPYGSACIGTDCASRDTGTMRILF
jgi:hypothetical protein